MWQTYTDFLRYFIFNDTGWVGFSSPTVSNFRYYTHSQIRDGAVHIPPDTQAYFTPAMHTKSTNVSRKDDVLGTSVLWVDCDGVTPSELDGILPPSIVVNSGHGCHAYFVLESPIQNIAEIERLNQILTHNFTRSDGGCWNVNRVLRLPNTLNLKDPQNPVKCEIVQHFNGIKYTPADIEAFSRLTDEVKYLIRTGDSTNFGGDRSERDWAVISHLIASGMRDEIIRQVFVHSPVGDKVRESPPHYFLHTLEKARNSRNVANIKKSKDKSIVAGDDGYYLSGQRISTFVLKPKVILQSIDDGVADSIICDVVDAQGNITPDVVFQKSSFSSVSMLDRVLSNANWQWMGSDQAVRKLLPLVLDTPVPRVLATSVLGLHHIKSDEVPHGKWYFVGDTQTLSCDALHGKYQGQITWLPTQKEHPSIDLSWDVPKDKLEYIVQNLPTINTPDVVWPLVGWFSAAVLKSWLLAQGYKFPILDVFGTKGAGKTTLIENVFMPLWGQTQPISWDAGTTPFVIRALSGSTNAIPVSYSEFRYSQVKFFLRVLLLSYDTGYDARGTASQTTVAYPLLSPIIITGEDMIDDPAVQERMVVVIPSRQTVEEGSEWYNNFKSFRANISGMSLGGWYIRQVLCMLEQNQLDSILQQARDDVFDCFPKQMPDRIRNNHIVVWFGVRLFCHITGCAIPDCVETLKTSIETLSGKSGKGHLLVDDFVTDIVAKLSEGTNVPFAYDYDPSGVVYFSMKQAHDWWIVKRMREQRGTLEMQAIRTQLQSVPYFVGQKVAQNKLLLLGVDLHKAQEYGLEVPTKININQFTFRF